MLSSVRCGILGLPAGCSGAMVVLGDQPSITPQLIRELLRHFDRDARGIIVPTYDGRRGHPLLLSASYFEEVLTRFDEVGLRGLLAAHPADVREVPTACRVIDDMDTPHDYARELRLAGLASAEPVTLRT